jgi:hypothetical protein
MLVRLIYKSRLKESVGWADVVNIASNARGKNESLNITGMLIMNGAGVLQVLEGESGAVNDLYGRICADERHGNLQLISFGALGERHFGRWKMKEVNLQRMKGDFRDVVASLLIKDEQGNLTLPPDFERAYALLAFIDTITSAR